MVDQQDATRKRRPGGGRKPNAAKELQRRIIENKLEEAEASFAYLVYVRNDALQRTDYRLEAAKEILNRVIGKPTEMQPQSKDDELYKAYSERVKKIIFNEQQTNGTETPQSGDGAVSSTPDTTANH